MDPQACFDRWLIAWRDDDIEGQAGAMADYNDWVWGGGFRATLPGGREVVALLPMGEIYCGPYARGTTAEKVLRDR